MDTKELNEQDWQTISACFGSILDAWDLDAPTRLGFSKKELQDIAASIPNPQKSEDMEIAINNVLNEISNDDFYPAPPSIERSTVKIIFQKWQKFHGTRGGLK